MLQARALVGLPGSAYHSRDAASVLALLAYEKQVLYRGQVRWVGLLPDRHRSAEGARNLFFSWCSPTIFRARKSISRGCACFWATTYRERPSSIRKNSRRRRSAGTAGASLIIDVNHRKARCFFRQSGTCHADENRLLFSCFKMMLLHRDKGTAPGQGPDPG